MADDSGRIASSPSMLNSLAYQGVTMGEPPPGGVAPKERGLKILEFPADKVRCSASWNDKTNVLQLVLDGAGKAIYLPWKEDHVSYTQLPASGALFVTGPFTGCNFYAAGSPESPVVMHTNSNASKGDKEANNKAKRELADKVMSLTQNSDPTHQMEWSDYAALGGATGYVFGFKNGNAWTFSFFGISTKSMKAFSAQLRRLA